MRPIPCVWLPIESCWLCGRGGSASVRIVVESFGGVPSGGRQSHALVLTEDLTRFCESSDLLGLERERAKLCLLDNLVLFGVTQLLGSRR